MWAAAIGALGILERTSGLPLLPGHPDGATPMVLWVEISVVLLGLGIVAYAWAERWRHVHGALVVVSTAISGIAFVTLIATARQLRLPGLDPARPIVALNLLLASSAFLLLVLRRARSAAALFALAVALVGFVVCLGFIYSSPPSGGTAWHLASLPAGLASLLIGAGLVAAAGPGAWPARLMVGGSVSAMLLRYLLPLTVLSVLVTDVTTLTVFAGLSHAVGSLLNTFAATIATLAVGYVIARILGTRLGQAEESASRLAKLNHALGRMNQLITRTNDADTLLREACAISVTECGFDMAWIGMIDPDTQLVRPVSAYGRTGNYLSGLRISAEDIPEGQGPSGRAVREGTRFFSHDIARDPRMWPWRDRALANGFRASAAFPLRTLGTVTHVFSVYAGEFGWFGDEQLQLLDELAADLSYALGALAKAHDREAAEQRLVASEARFRSLIENSTDLITIIDTEGMVVYQNPSIGPMLGYDPAERRGRSVLELIHPEDVWTVQEALKARRLPGATPQPVRCRIRHKTGRWRVVESVAWPSSLREGESELVIHTRDVTSRESLESQLRQSQKMEAVGQLAGGIAHDFNNLLSIIMTNASLLEESLAPGDQHAPEELADIVEAAERGKAMVRQLLGVSHSEELHIQPRDLVTIVEGVARMLRRILPGRIRIAVKPTPGLPPALVDPGAVEQILINLANNARDAMPAGGDLILTVEPAPTDEYPPEPTWQERPEGYLSLTVSDTGDGMDAETLRRLFEPFFTTKPKGIGTGLGMSMVQGLVHQQGGFIRVQSIVGAGTTVRLSFPSAATGVPIAPDLHPHHPARGPSTGSILVVEDEDALRRAAQRVLERAGFRVITAEHGAAALEQLRRHIGKVDLILTDLSMPTMGGEELYTEVTRQDDPPRFLFASGTGGEELDELGGLPRDVPFIRKPWTVDELLDAVREAMPPSGS